MRHLAACLLLVALTGCGEGDAGSPARPPETRQGVAREAVLAGLRRRLRQIARRLALTTGRVTIIAQAPAPALEPSFARRLSLERGLAMKAILVAGGLEAARIDIRPMGRQPNGVDVVDILPPGAAR